MIIIRFHFYFLDNLNEKSLKETTQTAQDYETDNLCLLSNGENFSCVASASQKFWVENYSLKVLEQVFTVKNCGVIITLVGSAICRAVFLELSAPVFNSLNFEHR